MPLFDDYDELNLTGIEIEPVELRVERLKASFGGGYGANASVGSSHGLWGWEIGSECLPDDADYQDLIAGVPRFQYYKDFFLDHTVGDSNEVFAIDFRGRKFHCSFADDSISGVMHSYDLFSLSGIKLEMRKVPGIYYRDDGSVFDPREITGLWGWYRSEDWDAGDLTDLSGNLHHLDGNGVITLVADARNDRDIVRLSSTGFFTNTASVRVYAALIALKLPNSTFSSAAGVLTGLGGSSERILIGTNAATKFANRSFGGTFQYKKDGTTYAESDEQAPMSAWGVVSVTSTGGIELDGLQFGKNRTTAATFAEADIGEILVYGTAPLATPIAPTAIEVTDLIGFLRRGWATPAS